MTSTTEAPVRIRRLSAPSEAELQQLAVVLVDCVEGGASVSFMLPLSRERALAFWRHVAGGVARGERALLVAEDGQGIVGTVQLLFDLPENQPHRAEPGPVNPIFARCVATRRRWLQGAMRRTWWFHVRASQRRRHAVSLQPCGACRIFAPGVVAKSLWCPHHGGLRA